MKVAPSLSPTRMPPSSTRSTKLVKANLVCLPVPSSSSSTNTPTEAAKPLFRQLFRSLDKSSSSCNHSPLTLLSPLPLRAQQQEFTPPPSPFGGSKTVKTAETESIASFSSGSYTPIHSTPTTPLSSPLSAPRTTIATAFASARPRIPSLGSSPSTHRGLVTPPKAYSKKTKSPPAAASSSRLQKVKTELCMYYAANEVCPYGASCHYAHGEHELQTKGLLALQKIGQIEDASTYRIKPCFSHVAMGSCPFGKRCSCIHDPRVTGTVQSWLPITETQGNNIMTDINVEGLHQKRRFDILYTDPFVRESTLVDPQESCGNGDENSYHSYEWNDLYQTIANSSNIKKHRVRRKRGGNGSKNRRHHPSPLSELHKVSIALQMHGGTHKWMYKYRPTHTIFNELCMVLDKRAFRLDEKGRAVSLPLSKYRPSNPNHCIVREIAFGPDGDPSVRPVALWFNISGDRVTECTLHKQKLFRWHKHKQLQQPKQSSSSSEGFQVVSASPFDMHESFVMIRPIDKDAFDLVQSTLQHRCASLKAEAISSIKERSRALEDLQTEHSLLGERFVNLKKQWAAWAYPKAFGRPSIDETTPVPPADAHYDPGEDDPTKECFSQSRKVWNSFLSTLEALKTDTDMEYEAPTSKRTPTGASYLMGDFSPKAETESKRLSVFVKLSHGQSMDQDNRSLPHIKRKLPSSKKKQAKPKESYSRQSERCWKSLFLENDGLQEAEWDAVVDHFLNSSRSQKVLNIVQQ